MNAKARSLTPASTTRAATVRIALGVSGVVALGIAVGVWALTRTEQGPLYCPRAGNDTIGFDDVHAVERATIREMVKSTKERGLDITGPDGLLKLLTKTVLETALEEEMSEHLGYDKNAPEGRNGGNSRNGTREKTVISDAAGEVTIEVPRDRDASFCPVIVKKRQRRLGDASTGSSCRCTARA